MPQMRRRGGGGQQQNNTARRMGRVWVLENGKPALAMFRIGATDGRMTQVLPQGEKPERPRAENADPAQAAAAERIKQAMERKLEPGTAVIVDTEIPKKS
jgi:hypothetical protein